MSTKYRKDGVLLKDPDPFHSIVPYVMPKRTEAEVSITKTFDITKLMEYIDSRNKEEGTNLKLFHCICTAIAKTIYHRPKMNIFIAGRHFYQRKDITLSFVAKQKFEDNAEETLMFMKVKDEMTVNDISKMILGEVKKVRESGTNSLDKAMDIVGKMPRFVLEIFFWILSRLEYHGMYPQGLSAGDPNYSTVLISNLGSIGSDSCYHHLSNFGTCSIMITIGTIKKGEESGKKTVDMTITIDERIADGFYFAKSLRYIDYCFRNPEFLEKEITEKFPEGIIEAKRY